MTLRLFKYVTGTSASTDSTVTTAAAGSSPVQDQNAPANQTAPIKYQETVGSYVESLIKLIPGEVIVTYPVISALAQSLPDFYLNSSIGGLIAVLLTYGLRSIALTPEQRPQKRALIFSTAACVIWVYQQGGMILIPIGPDWRPAVSIVLIIFVLIAPKLVDRDLKPA